MITVAATNRNGSRTPQGNYGATVEISAPGGETSTTSNGVLSTLNTGTQGPLADTYAFYQGTSMAAPHVSGVASLLYSRNPSLTPTQIQQILQSTVTPFPGGSTCNTSNCGTGILNARNAVAALTPVTNRIRLPLVLKSPSDSSCPAITNGNFESGKTTWTESSTHNWDIIISAGFPTGVTPHSGSWAAWLGGDFSDTSYVQQQVTIPSSCPYLTYWHWIASADVCGYDFANILINGTPVYSYDLCTSANTGGWVQKSVDFEGRWQSIGDPPNPGLKRIYR